MKITIALSAATLAASAAYSQSAETSGAQPVTAVAVASTPSAMLPANTEVTVSMNEELTSRRHHEGDTFNLTVAGDVRLGNYVVIPSGTRAVGEITWMTGRGMFGKSGKMDIAIRYIDLNGRHIPVEGTFRQEGEGNTVATVAGVLAAPIIGVFIVGHSAVIPAGRELTVRLRDNLAVALPAGATSQPVAVQAAYSPPAPDTTPEPTQPH